MQVTAIAMEFPTTRYLNRNHELKFGRLVFEKNSKKFK